MDVKKPLFFHNRRHSAASVTTVRFRAHHFILSTSFQFVAPLFIGVEDNLAQAGQALWE